MPQKKQSPVAPLPQPPGQAQGRAAAFRRAPRGAAPLPPVTAGGAAGSLGGRGRGSAGNKDPPDLPR